SAKAFIVTKTFNPIALRLLQQEVHVGVDRQAAGQEVQAEIRHGGNPAQAEVHTADLQLALVGILDENTCDGARSRIAFKQGAEAIRVIEREARVQSVDVVAAIDDGRGLQQFHGM